MKKLLTLLLGLLLVIPATARDFKFTYEGQTLKYTVVSEAEMTCMTKRGTVEKNSYRHIPGNEITGDVVIPTVAKAGKKEYTVIGIGEYSFANNKAISSVKLPETIIEIEPCAFRNSSLTSINLPGALTLIGKGTFAYTDLQDLTIDDSDLPLDLHTNMFLCDIKKAYIGRNIKIKQESGALVSRSIFDKQLKQLTFGNKVTEISDELFYKCKGLTSVALPESLKSIGSRAFYGCEGLTEIMLPNSIASIGDAAFQDCSSLSSVVIPGSMTGISDYTFCNCLGLRSVTIPNSVTSIGNYAFDGCKSLTSVKLPETLKSIGLEAFCGSGLTSITLPASLEAVGQYAFASTPITDVTMPDDFYTTLERKKYVFADTPYYRNLKSSANSGEADKLKKAVSGTWRVVNFDKNEGSITFNANGTYVCTYKNARFSVYNISYTEKGTWKFSTTSGKSYVKLTVTSAGPSAVITPLAVATAYQRKMPQVYAQMTAGEKTAFLKEFSDNREYQILSPTEMMNCTYGYDLEKGKRFKK